MFCDISKAFDRVWHRGLIHKLKKYGISGDLLDWIHNYLYMRNQRVFINGTFSSLKFILAGVPQGTVLGPLFFLIYINDLADYLHGMAQSEDEKSLSFSSNNFAFIEHILNSDLVKLKERAKKWLVKFNLLKTEVMVFSYIHNDYDIELSYDENILKIVENHKHLGVSISSNTKWPKHIDSIINSASMQMSYLRKLKFQLPKHTLNKLYCTYIRPLLEYASEVWDDCNLSDTNRLEQVQLHAARIVTGLLIFSSLRSLYLKADWETLAERRKIKKLIIMYKIIKNGTLSYLNDMLPGLVNDESNYNQYLRNNTNYDLPFCRLCSYETSYFPSTLKLWNDLNTETRNIPTLLNSNHLSDISHQE